MANNTKISLSIELQGSVVSRDNRGKIMRKYDGPIIKDKEGNPILLKDGTPKRKKGSIIYKTATLHKNLSQDFYDHARSDYRPQGVSSKEWSKLSPSQKLQFHLHQLTAHYGGTSFTFHIFED